MQTSNIGIIGCGNISDQYLKQIARYDSLNLSAVADLDEAKARAQAEKYSVPRVLGVEELLHDPAIEIVLNLTIPAAHAPVNRQALEQGKHAYCEKPFALTRAEGAEVVEFATARGLRTGCAPDTFLGGGLQTGRKLLDEGAIGRPVAAMVFMLSSGPERWHPNPGFFYQAGGGPLFDMGPYYLTALVSLLGPVRRVCASAQRSYTERTAGHESIRGTKIPVNIPTHISGSLDFAAGAVGTLVKSFDVQNAGSLPRIRIYGTEGTLDLPDPNGFGGEVKLYEASTKEWRDVPLTHSDEVGRGIGLADFASAIRNGRAPRASGEMALHVVDIMESLIRSSVEERHIHLEAGHERPAPLPAGLAPGEID